MLSLWYMPELPEVEMFKQYINATSLHQRIGNVTIFQEKVLENINKKDLKESLINNTLLKTNRIGKYVFITLESDSALVFHFGMTGFVKYVKDKNQQPAHTRVLLSFTNGSHLAYDCQRLFGLITITESVEQYVSNKKLGPDALAISKSEFLKNIASRKAKVKSMLMDQKLLSGIGNIYADEILFQSRVHPELKVNTLSNTKKTQIYDAISSVLKTAIQNNADFRKYPSEFIIPHRSKEGTCPLNDNHHLKSVKIAGRTSYFCPVHQRKS